MGEKKQIGSLSALKGLFIWVIVLHNTLSVDAVLEGIPGMAFVRLFGGSLGNSVFFMLSGFLMAISYRERIAGGESVYLPEPTAEKAVSHVSADKSGGAGSGALAVWCQWYQPETHCLYDFASGRWWIGQNRAL